MFIVNPTKNYFIRGNLLRECHCVSLQIAPSSRHGISHEQKAPPARLDRRLCLCRIASTGRRWRLDLAGRLRTRDPHWLRTRCHPGIGLQPGTLPPKHRKWLPAPCNGLRPCRRRNNSVDVESQRGGPFRWDGSEGSENPFWPGIQCSHHPGHLQSLERRLLLRIPANADEGGSSCRLT